MVSHTPEKFFSFIPGVVGVMLGVGVGGVGVGRVMLRVGVGGVVVGGVMLGVGVSSAMQTFSLLS